jgi:hypothetical protein
MRSGSGDRIARKLVLCEIDMKAPVILFAMPISQDLCRRPESPALRPISGKVWRFDGRSRPPSSGPGDHTLLRTNCGHSTFDANVPELRERRGVCRLRDAAKSNARTSSATIGDPETKLAVQHRSRAVCSRELLQDEGVR